MAERSSNICRYFLTRTSPVGLDMFKSIMDLPKEEAERITAEFTCKSSCRGSYYDHRKEVESWLRDNAGKAGVSIENQNPLYFMLKTEAINGLQDNGERIDVSLPASAVDLSHCSFTVEDSFCNHEHVRTGGKDAYGAKHPLLGQVFNAAQMEEAIHQHNLMDFLDKNPDTYIEVQMWARPR